MQKHEFSYWLNVSADKNLGADRFNNSAKRLETALRGHDCLWPEGPLVLTVDADDMTVSGEVNPVSGTVTEDSDIENRITKVMAGFPEFDGSFLEMDEEDKSIQRLSTYKMGALTQQRVSRLVPAENSYDAVTVKAIAGYLNASGREAIAHEVLEQFFEK